MLNVKYYTAKDREFFALCDDDPIKIRSAFVQEKKKFQINT
jgi:hypothetical protein